jgi:predicted ATPase
MPYLTKIWLLDSHPLEYPFNLDIFKDGLNLSFSKNVSFFVGENGTGKSTLIEAIAEQCGFNLSGGNRNHIYDFHETESKLANYLKLSWEMKVNHGFFMRAESFFNFATYVDQVAKEDRRILDAYGGKSLHEQSHGESFFSLFYNQFQNGIYILDEPEAALSPQRQLAFLSIIHELEQSGKAQFIIATHSPILLAYPKATIYSLDEGLIHEVSYRETEHYKLTKQFLESPEQYFRYLFTENNS